MEQASQNPTQNSQVNQVNQTHVGFFSRILNQLDIFSYVPIPQAYPVSTNKSKIGSIIVLLLFIAYLGYDLYLYITKSSPTINAYQAIIEEGQSFTVPRMAFGIGQLYQSYRISYVYQDPTIFSFQMKMLKLSQTEQDQYIDIPLIKCNMQELSNQTTYSFLGGNLTCLNMTTALQFTKNKKVNIIFQISMNFCFLDEQCANKSDIIDYFNQNFPTFNIFLLQPKGFDYSTGTQIDPIETFFYQVPFFTAKQIYMTVTPTTFQISPNYLTSFLQKTLNYSRISKQKQVNYRQITSVQSFNTLTYQPLRINIVPDVIKNIILIQPQTIIDRVSSWSALFGLIFFITALCFLGYNRNKFNKRNPDWERFDEFMKQKFQLQMQNLNIKRTTKQKIDNYQGSEISNNIQSYPKFSKTQLRTPLNSSSSSKSSISQKDKKQLTQMMQQSI